jgi:hypothetical protein
MEKSHVDRLVYYKGVLSDAQGELRLRAEDLTPHQKLYLYHAADLISLAWQYLTNATRVEDAYDLLPPPEQIENTVVTRNPGASE